MEFFNFHHHNREIRNGIYNLKSVEEEFSEEFSVGIHPMEINENTTADLFLLKEKAAHPCCIAIGECGLDARAETSQKQQTEIFINQIKAANELKKPVIVHCVKKFPEIISLKKNAATPWILHGFNKNKSTADALLSAGFYLSFGNALLHNLSLQNIFRETDLNKIFLETDDGGAEIEKIYEKASELKQLKINSLQEQILENLHGIKR